jgi:basic membrane protein A
MEVKRKPPHLLIAPTKLKVFPGIGLTSTSRNTKIYIKEKGIMKFRKLFSGLVLLCLVVALSACAQSSSGNSSSTKKKDAKKVLVIVPGNLGDKSFFDSAAAGIDALKKEHGDKIVTKINELGPDYSSKEEPALTQASNEDWNIIVCISYDFAPLIQKIAPQHKDKRYIIVDSTLDYSKGDMKNAMGLTFKTNEGSYLAGIVAASLSKTGKIGFLGGMEIPLIQDFLVGYIKGAQSVNPDIKVKVSYIGSFSDSAKGKELALAQYASGVDVGYNVAGGAGLGQIDAAQSVGKLAIGVDSDQAMIFDNKDPDKANVIPTSTVKDVGGAIKLVVDQDYKGEASWGADQTLGVKEGLVHLADNKYYQKLVPADVQQKVKDAQDKIISGDITVPTGYDKPANVKKIIDSAK